MTTTTSPPLAAEPDYTATVGFGLDAPVKRERPRIPEAAMPVYRGIWLLTCAVLLVGVLSIRAGGDAVDTRSADAAGSADPSGEILLGSATTTVPPVPTPEPATTHEPGTEEWLGGAPPSLPSGPLAIELVASDVSDAGQATVSYRVTTVGAPVADLRFFSSLCSLPEATTGDADANGILDPQEQWVVDCVGLLNADGHRTTGLRFAGVGTYAGVGVRADHRSTR